MINQELFNKLLDEGKLRWSRETCSNDGCDNPLVEPLAFNSTRSHPFGYICQECGELKTQEAIARATVSRLEYSIRTDK